MTLSRLGLARIVIQHRPQPAFGLDERPVLASGIIFDLIAFDFPDAEIAGFGMAEV